MNATEKVYTKNTATLRAFIAIALPRQIKKDLALIQSRLRARSKGAKVSWPKPAAMHLTLKFIGDIHPERLPDIEAAMTFAAKEASPFELTLGDLGGFPSLRKCRVIWTGVEGRTTELYRLVRKLDMALETKACIPRSPKKFVAHLTLARVRRPMDLNRFLGQEGNRIQPVFSRPFKVSELILFKSTLLPSGACHEKIVSVGLGR